MPRSSTDNISARECMAVRPHGALDQAHSKVHDGVFYSHAARQADMAAAATWDMVFVTGGTATHMAFELAAGASFQYDFYEGASITAGSGVTATALNMNRLSANTASTYFVNSATVGTVGSILKPGFMPGGDDKTAVGSSDSGFARAPEMILKKNEKYLIRMTNMAAVTATASMQFGFYEGF